MVQFTGKINNIVFQNEKDLYKILDVEILGKLKNYPRSDIKVTGNFGDIQIGENYNFDGYLIMHDKFGLQFRVNNYKQLMPHEEISLTKYLSSNKFPGIGIKAATTIINELGLNVLDSLKKNPTKISTLSLTQRQKDSLLKGINTIDSFSEIILKLAQFGINKKVATHLYKIYQGDVLQKLQKNPYASIAKVSGYAFKTADLIGKEIGLKIDSPERVQGAIYQVLSNALNSDGYTYVTLPELLTQTSKLLNINKFDPIATEVNHLQEQGKIIVDGKKAALTDIYQAEEEIARIIKNLLERHNKSKNEKYSDDEIEKVIKKVENQLKISYDTTQKSAIKNALNNPISILTGGPGTGKTTIINGILLALRFLADIPASALYSENPPFLLAAPTGRAAKRMSEISGITAKTIHRMLGLGIGDNNSEDLNELNGEILIIDEMSMVDMFLFRQLISSINQTKHIVFVGDKNQLPSVGAGNIFSDLIKSKAFPTTILEHIHRQDDNSTIITLAHKVNQGKDQNIIFKKTKNYSFISCNPQQVNEAVNQIVSLALKRGVSKDEIQVLGAMYHGIGGINNLNDILQEIMNPVKDNNKQIEAHGEFFRIGDRLLQLQNNFEKNIYNGQIGKVIGINEKDSSKCLIVKFDEREIEFGKKDLSDLTRAYAITIHKSQGSEFPLIILSLTMQNYVMLKRNLLYTAITRAERNLVLIGEPRAYITALNTPGNDRQTGLADKLCEQLKITKTAIKQDSEITNFKKSNAKFYLTKDKIYSGQIDPMIGMEGVVLRA